jgi:hypothetical protein
MEQERSLNDHGEKTNLKRIERRWLNIVASITLGVFDGDIGRRLGPNGSAARAQVEAGIWLLIEK